MRILLLVTLLAAPLFAQDVLDPDVRAAAERALQEPAPDLHALYDQAILAHGDHAALLAYLEGLSDEGDDAATRLASQVLWRAGDLTTARALLKPLIDEGADQGTRLLYARLLDAIDWTDEAIELYEEILAGSEDAELSRWLQLRLALMTMERGPEHKDALAEFAGQAGQPREFRNRAAIVLALLGRPADAIELYLPTEEEGTPMFRDLVRLAEWAVRAEDAEQAKDFAWRASRAATLTRDRAYSLAVLVEAHRLDDSLDALHERFAGTRDLSEAHRSRWIELLRDLDRTEEAIALFTADGQEDFERAERRELLEMFRDAGQEQRMVAEFRSLIELEPRTVLWSEGLARFYLENGDREAAVAVWRPFVDAPVDIETLTGAEALMGLGLDGLAIECAEACIDGTDYAYPALLFLYGLHSDRGRLPDAEQALRRLDDVAPADHGVRMDLAECYERLGLQERALDIFLGLEQARPDKTQGEDMSMRLAWLYSEVGREEEAMTAWLALWERVESVPRRRYVEDRLMTVASRLGTLADVAIDLERKLVAGTANKRESGLLVRLYTKVGDSVSATEVIEEFMKQTGGEVKDILEEKARVYVSCTDYARYEDTVRELMAIDAENEGEYLRQLAMSMLERGKPDEARVVLARLKELESDSSGDEFEAGVLAIAGMREEAMVAYRKGIARHPERIDSLLLLANVMKDVGRTSEAIGLFQHMLEIADKDDLFTIAVDGLLNMEAPSETLRWARRIVLERLAGREGKMYLFQLYSDLSEELDDRDAQMVALENALPIAGTRRPSLLRELMDLAAIGGEDEQAQLSYGRRLIGLSEIVPPQVYLDLGESFLRAGEIKNAAKTFRLASDQPDYARLQRQAAGLFDEQGYPAEALTEYERVLVSQATDVGLMAKVAELCEQLGKDERALALYVRAMELLHQRRPLRTGKAEEEDDDPFSWWRARNVDDYDQHHARVRKGLLATMTEADATGLIEAELAAALRDLTDLEAGVGEGTVLEELALHPRLLRRAQHHRRLALASGRVEEADQLDLRLLTAFSKDEGLLETLVQERVTWGLVGSGRRLIEESGRPEEVTRKLRFLVGEGTADDAVRLVPLGEATRLLLPRLAVGDSEGVEAILRRVDLGSVTREELPGMQVLFSAAQVLDDTGLMLSLGRQWVRIQVKSGTSQYELEPILERAGAALPDEERLALYQYFISLVLEEPEKAANFVPMLPKLQSIFDDPLLSQEQIAELLDGYGERGYGWGLGPVLVLLPEEERAGALRSVWSKIQATQKTGFLLRLLNEVNEPLGDELAGFVGDAFEEALAEADDFFVYYIRQLWEENDDLELLGRMHVALANKKPRDWNVRGLGWILEFKQGHLDEAVQLAAAVYVDSLEAPPNEYDARNVRNRVHMDLLPEHLTTLLAAFDEATGERAPTVELAQQRLDLVQAAGDDEATLAAYLKAVADQPEEVELLDKLRNFYQRIGRPMDALATLERIAELEPDKRQWQRQLMNTWSGLRNPIKALAAREKHDALPEDEDAGGSGIPGYPAGFVLPAGSMVIINGVRYGGGASTQKNDPRRQKPATIQRVHEAFVDEQDTGDARQTLRRLWRDFRKGEQTDPYGFAYYGWGYGRLARLNWPELPKEEDEAEAEEKLVYRGGLSSFREEDSEERPEATNAWEVLAAESWGADEMRRFARTFEAREIDGYQPFFEGLLVARLASEAPQALMDELLAAVSGETGGRVEQVLLLSLLDRHPELADERVRAVLDDLVGAANPIDGQQVRRLAGMHRREGRLAEAVRLYRWCATQTSSVNRFAFDGPQPLNAHELVKEAKEHLEGAARDEVVEAILTYANPGKARWQRETFETLALTTWAEMYGPDEALALGRVMCEAAIDPSTGLRRRSAKEAAYLFARANEIDQALVALEYAVAKMDPELFTNVDDPWFRLWPQNYGYLSHVDLKKLFPREWEGDWDRARDWHIGAADRIATWMADERMNSSTAVDALALIIRRLVAMGETDAAAEAAQRLVALAAAEDLSPSKQLWVIDAAREAGLEVEAHAIECALLSAHKLHVERVTEVVRRVREQAGPEAARALAEQVARVVQHEDLIELLVALHTDLGDATGVARWSEHKQAVVAAQEALEAAAEAEQEAREAKDG